MTARLTQLSVITLLAMAACDSDKDGFAASEDCNDEDPEIFPGSLEVCDGADNDCDGLVDYAACDTAFGPAFRVTIVSAANGYTWDPNALTNGARPADMWVSYGTQQDDVDKIWCHTEEVTDSSTAEWNTSCDVVFEHGDTFYLSLLDQDVLTSEGMGHWQWAGDEIIDLVALGSDNVTLTAGNSTLVFRIEPAL